MFSRQSTLEGHCKVIDPLGLNGDAFFLFCLEVLAAFDLDPVVDCPGGRVFNLDGSGGGGSKFTGKHQGVSFGEELREQLIELVHEKEHFLVTAVGIFVLIDERDNVEFLEELIEEFDI